jgi:acyl carrier protein
MSENTQDNLEGQVRALIASVIRRDAKELKLDANFYKDLGVDSIKAIEIVVAIERNFKISIRDEQVRTVATIGQAVEAVKEALRKKNEQ